MKDKRKVTTSAIAGHVSTWKARLLATARVRAQIPYRERPVQPHEWADRAASMHETAGRAATKPPSD